MTLEEYKKERTIVHSNLEVYHYEYIDYDGDCVHEGVPLCKVLEFVDALEVSRDKIYCDIDVVSWYTPPTIEEIDEKVACDVQGFIEREARNKKANLKMYLGLRKKYGELSETEIEKILED